MYERNAIVIDRWFSDMFGYGEKSNLKNNYNKYCDLVKKISKYNEVSENEDNMMVEFEKAVNEIKETQKEQKALETVNTKLQESRKSLFENLDEDAEILKKKFAKIEEELFKNAEEIKENSTRFAKGIENFNEKSIKRNESGKERRTVENAYQKSLLDIKRNMTNFNLENLKTAKDFLKQEDLTEIKESINEQIIKNGEKEKIPFDEDVIERAIEAELLLEKRRLEIIITAYEKSIKLLDEIKNDNVKMEKYEKNVRDSANKLKFLNVINEYIILFLDNERMSIAGGKKEHRKIMLEACLNFEKDMQEINNLYEILKKEVLGKATKKMYRELYNPSYLVDLQNDEKAFEKSIKKINVIGTVIYPNYWRIEGIQKIFETFKEIVVNDYEADLSEFETEEVNNIKENEELDNNEFEKKLYAGIYTELEEDKILEYDEEDDEEDYEEDDEYENEDDKDFEDYEEDDISEEVEEEVEEEAEEEEYDEDDNDEDEEDNDDIELDEDNYSEWDDKKREEKRDRDIDEILGYYNLNVEDEKLEYEEDDDEDEKDNKDIKNTEELNNKEIEIDFNWDEDDNSSKKKKSNLFGKKKEKKKR